MITLWEIVTQSHRLSPTFSSSFLRDPQASFSGVCGRLSTYQTIYDSPRCWASSMRFLLFYGSGANDSCFFA